MATTTKECDVVDAKIIQCSDSENGLIAPVVSVQPRQRTVQQRTAIVPSDTTVVPVTIQAQRQPGQLQPGQTNRLVGVQTRTVQPEQINQNGPTRKSVIDQYRSQNAQSMRNVMFRSPISSYEADGPFVVETTDGQPISFQRPSRQSIKQQPIEDPDLKPFPKESLVPIQPTKSRLPERSTEQPRFQRRPREPVKRDVPVAPRSQVQNKVSEVEQEIVDRVVEREIKNDNSRALVRPLVTQEIPKEDHPRMVSEAIRDESPDVLSLMISMYPEETRRTLISTTIPDEKKYILPVAARSANALDEVLKYADDIDVVAFVPDPTYNDRVYGPYFYLVEFLANIQRKHNEIPPKIIDSLRLDIGKRIRENPDLVYEQGVGDFLSTLGCYTKE